jgi:hypothetical protein
VPMFARYINEVGVGQPLREIPWERPPTVKPGDTGGKVRTTVDEVLADGKAPPPSKPKPAAAKPAAPAVSSPKPAAAPTAKKHPHGH